jgi:hypothetical protein
MDFRTLAVAKKYTDTVVTESGLKGKDGKDGKSAYQYALEGGYQGTEQEFMQSMASASLEIYTVQTIDELPYPGNENYVYRVTNEASLFQWNGSGYESLNYTESELNINLIHGGTANGTNS